MSPATLGDLVIVSPMIALFLASLIPITMKVLKGNKEQPPLAALTQGLGGLIACAILMMTVYVLVGEKSSPTAFSDTLVLDGVTVILSILCLLVGAGSLLLMYDNPATHGEQFSEIIFLTLNSVLGMIVLVSAVDLLTAFIGLETMSLSLYMMIAISNEGKLSKEAAFKYFVLGGFASAIYLYGVSFLFGTMGSTSIRSLVELTPQLASSSRLFLFGITLVIIGFCFKISLAPFHAWTPDVYQGSPTPHAGLMATAVKAVSFAALLRLVASNALVESENLLDFLQWVTVFTMLVGNLAAILQHNLKRMFAYSSIAHSGYLMVGVLAAGVSDQMTFGASGVLFYLIGYAVMTLGGFAVICYLESKESSSISLENLAGLAKKHPIASFCLTLFLLSLAGIPPSVGFFGKFYIFSAAIGEGLLWLAIWGVINSVLSVYYYLRPIIFMYMKEPDELSVETGELQESYLATKIAMAICGAFVIILGVVSGPIFKFIEKAIL